MIRRWRLQPLQQPAPRRRRAIDVWLENALNDYHNPHAG
jgi:hypothetical protein